MIKPTIGRVVLVFARATALDKRQPEPALVTYVHSDTYINVGGFDRDGKVFGLTSVYLVQDESPPLPEGSLRAEWMPFQKGQVAKTEQLEKQIGGAA